MASTTPDRAPNPASRRAASRLALWQLPYVAWSVGAVVVGLAMLELATGQMRPRPRQP